MTPQDRGYIRQRPASSFKVTVVQRANGDDANLNDAAVNGSAAGRQSAPRCNGGHNSVRRLCVGDEVRDAGLVDQTAVPP